MPSHVPRISLLSCLDLSFSEHMFTCVNITNEPHLRQILNLNKPRITYSAAWCSYGLANLSNICENMDSVKEVHQKITSLISLKDSFFQGFSWSPGILSDCLYLLSTSKVLIWVDKSEKIWDSLTWSQAIMRALDLITFSKATTNDLSTYSQRDFRVCMMYTYQLTWANLDSTLFFSLHDDLRIIWVKALRPNKSLFTSTGRTPISSIQFHLCKLFLIPKTDKLIEKLANFLSSWYKESLKHKPGTWYIAFLALFLGHWAPLAWRPAAKNKQNCLTSSSMCGWAGEIDEARFSYQNYTLWEENRGLMNYCYTDKNILDDSY